MNPELEGYAAAVPAAADLAAVDALFVANTALQAALTDTSIAPATRRAVLSDLLEGKVSEDARRMASFAAGAVPAPEVPAAIAWLAQRARRAAAGGAEELAPLGHLGSRVRVGGFATAVLEDLDTGSLEEVEDELFRFARTVETTPALRSALSDRELPGEVRRDVVIELLHGRALEATERLMAFAVSAGRPRDVVGTMYWLVDRVAEARGWRVAVVDAARPVDDEERRKLSESLARLVGAPVDLEVRVDPALLAGVRVRIGDVQVEATARGRLDELREHVVASGWENRGLSAAGRGGD